MKYIAVFCSANDLTDKHIQPAKELAKLIGENGYNLVWGGSDTGLMKIVASAVREGGGEIIGISVELLKDKARIDADEMIIAKNLGERKATMLKRSDAFVALVGGTGTLDEVTEIIELKKEGVHNKPIVVLNIENFYEGLKLQLGRMKAEGFIIKPLDDLVVFANDPSEAIQFINKSLGHTP